MTKFKITGIKTLTNLFDRNKKKANSASVIVGYTANYALFVHEMVGANFQRPGARAKFLEHPLRDLRPELAQTVEKAVAKGATVQQGLVMAGLRLQRESQNIVPLDTGNLRASAYTRVEK